MDSPPTYEKVTTSSFAKSSNLENLFDEKPTIRPAQMKIVDNVPEQSHINQPTYYFDKLFSMKLYLYSLCCRNYKYIILFFAVFIVLILICILFWY